MGGGKKQSKRTKGNLKPSSSSRAAETLIQEGKTGFIGFGGLSEATGNVYGYVPQAVGNENEADQDIDSDMRMTMRKMTKKDTTTRLKAVQEFSKLCSVKPSKCVADVLSFWPKIYNKLCEDIDHRVREANQLAHLQIVTKVGKQLAPQLKLIIGYWIKSHFDQFPPAATVARRSFDLCFSGEKKKEVLSFCRKELITNIKTILIQETQDTLSDPKVVPVEERESKYNRLISATLLSTSYLLNNLSQDDVNSLSSEIEDILEEKKFWKFSKHKSAMIRNAFFTAVSSLCQNCNQILKEFSKVACPTVLLCLDESDPTVVRSLWDCILHIINSLEDCWERVNARKAVLPKLWSTLRGSGFGNASVVYPNILPFLSKIPPTVIGDDEGFYREFFKNFREGLLNCGASASENNAIMSAYMECLRFVVLSKLKNQQENADGVDKEAEKVYDYLINEEIYYLTRESLQAKKKHWRKVFLIKLSNFLLYLEKQVRETGRMEERKVLEKFYTMLEKSCLHSLSLEDIDINDNSKEVLKSLERFIEVVIFKADDKIKEKKKTVLFSCDDNEERSEVVDYWSLMKQYDSAEETSHMDAVEKNQVLSQMASLFLLKFCQSSVQLLFAKKNLVYFGFMCNVVSYMENGPLFCKLVKVMLKTKRLVTEKLAKEVESDGNEADGAEAGVSEKETVSSPSGNEIDFFENEAEQLDDLTSLGHEFIDSFIKAVMQDNFSPRTSFWESLDCQEAAVSILCRLLLFLEKQQRVGFMSSLAEMCSKPLMFCLLIEKVLLSVEAETLQVWFATSVSWNRLKTYLSQCLAHSDETNNPDTEIHVWRCLQQCLFYQAEQVPLLDSDRTEELFIILKNHLSTFEDGKNTKDCLRILCIMTEVYERHTDTDKLPLKISDLLVACFQLTARTAHSSIVQQGTKMLQVGMDLLRNSSSSKLNDCLQRIGHWVKITSHETTYIEKLKKLVECSGSLITYLKADDRSTESIHDFIKQTLESNEVKNIYRKGKYLLPSILSGVLNVENLNESYVGEENVGIQKALSFALHALMLLCKIDGVSISAELRNDTILNAVDLCVYSAETKISNCVSDEESVREFELLFAELDQMIRGLLQKGDFSMENLLQASLVRSAKQGGLYVLSLDRLCALIHTCSSPSRLPMDYLLAYPLTLDYYNVHSVDTLKVILTYVEDVSMIRAMVAKYWDELDYTTSDEIKSWLDYYRRSLDLCFTSVIRWQQILQSRKEKPQDFTEVVWKIMDHLSEWDLTLEEIPSSASASSLNKKSLLFDINIRIMRLFGFILAAHMECLKDSHWDLLLCSMATWIQLCKDNMTTIAEDPRKMVFAYEVFNLCASIGKAFELLTGTYNSTANVIKPELVSSHVWHVNSEWIEKNRQKDFITKVISEWQELFAPVFYSGLHLLYKEVLAKASEEQVPSAREHSGIASYLLQSLTCALYTIPATVYIDIVAGRPSFEEQLIAGDAEVPSPTRGKSIVDDTQAPKIVETVEGLSSQLSSEFYCVQTLAFSLLCKMIDHVGGTIATLTDESTEGDECDLVRSFPAAFHSILESCQEKIIDFLEAESIKFGSYLQVSPPKHQTTSFLGYMFAWQCILRMFRGAEADQRAAFANFFRKRGLIPPLLKILFSLLPYQSGHVINGRVVAIKGEAISLQTLQHCAFHVYLLALECIPALIRSWCNNNMDRKSSAIIERFTTNFVSPIICNREMEQVNNSSKTFNNMSIKTRLFSREVVAMYTVDEISMELVVKLSPSHPFGHVTVECGKRVGVSNAQWRNWMLQLTQYLMQQNGTIVDGLALWKKNVDKKFEGVEECMVCFAVLHESNYQLPAITCRVCKKKFHSACLYKWFSTSNKSTCPLCRNSF